MREMKLQDLKTKTPGELVSFAEELEVENASTMRKQGLIFGILKQLSMRETDIVGEGVVEVLSDGFGFLRSPEANYLPGPDDIYVSPSQIRRFGLRTGDTIDGHIRSPKEGERYFALLKVNTINFEDPDKARHKVNFDNLTPLYPDERLRMEHEDPTKKDLSPRVIDIVAPIGKGQRALIVSPPRTGKIRTFSAERVFAAFATAAPRLHVINALTNEEHPVSGARRHADAAGAVRDAVGAHARVRRRRQQRRRRRWHTRARCSVCTIHHRGTRRIRPAAAKC